MNIFELMRSTVNQTAENLFEEQAEIFDSLEDSDKEPIQG